MIKQVAFAALLASAFSTAGCTATISQASFFPSEQLKAPDARLQVPPGYSVTDRLFDLPGLGKLRAVLLDNPASDATIVYSAGNGGFVDSETTSAMAASFASLTGADVIVYDYPGRGGTTVPATIDAAIAVGPVMIGEFKAAGWMGRGPAYAYGLSFGGSMAAAMARNGGFAGLIIEGSASDYEAIGRDFVPGMAKPFVKVKVAEELRAFDYLGYTVAAKAPVLLLSGNDDEIVRPKQMRKFADVLTAQRVKVTFTPVPVAHGGALEASEGSAALRAFVATDGSR